MLDELHTASNVLKSALERYLNACLAITSQYELGSALDGFSKAIVNELQQTTAYETKIYESKKILRKARNRRPDLVPISILPPELLSHIFLRAHRQEPCFLKDRHALSYYPSKSPESLSQVCSYWRSIALGTPALWTHIDLAPYSTSYLDFLGYAEIFAANTGHTPLNIHISMGGPIACLYHKPQLLKLCASIAAKAKSLKVRSLHVFSNDEISIFENLFGNCVPRKLTRLVMMDGDETVLGGFMIAKDAERPADEEEEIWPLDIPHRHLEEVLRHVTVLRLAGLYPYWTSQAYHGLTKLHLTDRLGTFITVSQLASILRASPQLRFFYFGIAITDDGTSPEPVRLDNLEVFHLDVEDPLEHDGILRIISPGVKPLRMSTTLGQNEQPYSTGSEHSRFFARSNVTQLRVDLPYGAESLQLELPKLLALVPNLQVLSLDGFDLKPACKGSPDPDDDTGSVSSRLANLHLASSTINPEVLRWVTETYPIQRITIDERTCWVESGGDPEDACRIQDCGNELLEICTAVKFVSSIDPVKDENWN